MKWLDRMNYLPLIVIAIVLGSAPFSPEPHVWEKLKMLMNGVLVKPVDIFDFIFHGAAPALLITKFLRSFLNK